MARDALARALEEQASGRFTTVRDWLREHPPRPDRLTQTLASVAARAKDGEPFLPAIREFLDEFAIRDLAQRIAAITDPAPLTGERRSDAFIGALAEHLALREGIAVPAWASADERFLDTFWFVSDVRGFRAVAIAAAPAAFRRRGVFLHPRALERH